MKKILCYLLWVAIAVIPAFAAGPFHVLVILGDSSAQSEADFVASQTNVEGIEFIFDVIPIGPNSNRPPAGALEFAEEVDKGNIVISDYQIFWFCWNGPGHDGSYLLGEADVQIKEAVKNGAVAWTAAFDDNFQGRNGTQIGDWFPVDEYPVTIADTGDSNVDITPEGEASGLFSTPNKVDMNALTLDDNFAGLTKDFVVLAERSDGAGAAAFMLRYGKGAYAGVCYDSRQFPSAQPLVPNALYYCANLVTPTAVEPNGKLATRWATIK